MKHFASVFKMTDEMYILRDKPYSRDKVRVLARLDASKLDMTKKDIHRKDADFPVAMAKNYGKGRVFWSTFGHAAETWDDPAVQKMYLEALKWSMGLTNADVTPRPMPVATSSK